MIRQSKLFILFLLFFTVTSSACSLASRLTHLGDPTATPQIRRLPPLSTASGHPTPTPQLADMVALLPGASNVAPPDSSSLNNRPPGSRATGQTGQAQALPTNDNRATAHPTSPTNPTPAITGVLPSSTPATDNPPANSLTTLPTNTPTLFSEPVNPTKVIPTPTRTRRPTPTPGPEVISSLMAGLLQAIIPPTATTAPTRLPTFTPTPTSTFTPTPPPRRQRLHPPAQPHQP